MTTNSWQILLTQYKFRHARQDPIVASQVPQLAQLGLSAQVTQKTPGLTSAHLDSSKLRQGRLLAHHAQLERCARAGNAQPP